MNYFESTNNVSLSRSLQHPTNIVASINKLKVDWMKKNNATEFINKEWCQMVGEYFRDV